ncbi:MAG: hypothetical protein JSW31_04335, partial [Burkholderiales bacterium]
MGGTIDGRSGDHVLLAPPFIIGEREITLIVDALSDALQASLAAIGRTVIPLSTQPLAAAA